MGFRHLSFAECAVILAEARRGSGQREIARCLGRGIGRKPRGGSSIVRETLKIIHRSEEVEARLIPGQSPVG